MVAGLGVDLMSQRPPPRVIVKRGLSCHHGRKGGPYAFEYPVAVGFQESTYVSNIYKYCITYRLVTSEGDQRDAAKAQLGKPK
jgi:hypothetical protein